MQLSTNSISAKASRSFFRRKKHTPNKAGIYTALLGLSVLFAGPFLWLVTIALKTDVEMNVFPVQILPAQPAWSNFSQALGSINFFAYAGNSLTISTIYATLVTLSSALVGFGFARLKGPGKKGLFFLMLSTMMLPNIVTLIPTYIIFSHLGMIDTFWPWVLWGLASTPFLAFLFRQFFSALPLELEEAAILDGCGYGRIFWSLFLPLSLPVLVTAFLISFTGVWGDYITPSLLLNQDNTTLAVALSNSYVNAHGIGLPNIQAAGTLFYIVPEIIVFLFAQRYFVRGIVTSGMKG